MAISCIEEERSPPPAAAAAAAAASIVLLILEPPNFRQINELAPSFATSTWRFQSFRTQTRNKFIPHRGFHLSLNLLLLTQQHNNNNAMWNAAIVNSDVALLYRALLLRFPAASVVPHHRYWLGQSSDSIRAEE
jgi:hypothetical protein